MLKDKIKREMPLHGILVSPILDLENGCFHSYCVFYINVYFAVFGKSALQENQR